MRNVLRDRAGWRVLFAWLALLGIIVGGVAAAGARPVALRLNLGQEEGWASDLPLAVNWNGPEETAEHVKYRWSGIDSAVQLPGVRGVVALRFTLLSTALHPARATGALGLGLAGGAVAVPLRGGERAYHVVAPARGGTLAGFDAPVWTPAGDERTLGVPVGDVRIVGLRLGVPGPALWWPVWAALLLGAAVWWASRRPWRGLAAAALVGGLGIGAVAGDAARAALVATPLAWGGVWGAGLALAALWALRRWSALDVGARRAVVVVFGALVAVRLVGRLYPEAMLGDRGFHENRLNETSRGAWFIVSRHRGIDFPYPSGPYSLLLPGALVGISWADLVEWADAVLGAGGVVALGLLGWHIGARLAPGDAGRARRLATLAALSYAALAPAMMALFWSFLPHIFTQEALAVGIAAAALGWERLVGGRGGWLLFAGLALICFGHLGIFLNVSLLAPLALAWRWLRHPAERGGLRRLALIWLAAELTVVALFFSSYTSLIAAKLAAFAAGGMSAVQERAVANTPAELLGDLWTLGVGRHYAWIGLPVALLGGAMLLRRLPGAAVTTLWWATLAVAAAQAAVPFLTASTISTRWLSFCAWAVAVGVALVAEWLWRRGRWGQAAALVGLGWLLGSTLWLAVQATAYRIRPIEPF